MIAIAVVVWDINLRKILYGFKGDAITSPDESKQDSAQITSVNAPEGPAFNPEGRDPFGPAVIKQPANSTPQKVGKPTQSETQPPPWRLDGVLWQEGNPVAILKQTNTDRTEMVKEKGVVEEMVIEKIEKDKVHVLYRKKAFVIQ